MERKAYHMLPPLLTERGDVNIIALMFGLPVLLMIVVAAFDIMRVPLVEQALMHSLHEAAFDVVPNWNCSDDKYPCELDVADPSKSPQGFGIEPFFPVAFMDVELLANKVSPCVDSNLPSKAFLGGNDLDLSAQSMLDLMAGNIISRLKSSLSKKAALVAIDPDTQLYATVSVGVLDAGDPGTLSLGNVPLVVIEDVFKEFYYPNQTAVGPLANLFSWNSKTLLKGLADSSPGPWSVYPCVGSCVDNDATALASNSAPKWLAQQKWVIVVAYIKLKSIFGKFSLMGGNDPTDPGSYVVMVNVIRPLGQTVGLQC